VCCAWQCEGKFGTLKGDPVKYYKKSDAFGAPVRVIGRSRCGTASD
jgi:hypothetical protein